MRFLTWLISLPVFAAVILFVLQNRMRVTLSFWPFDAQLDMPVSILSLGLLLLGFVIGAAVASVATFTVSREARKYKREVSNLNEKLKAQGTPTVAVPAVFVGGAYKTLSPSGARAPARQSLILKLYNRMRGRK